MLHGNQIVDHLIEKKNGEFRTLGFEKFEDAERLIKNLAEEFDCECDWPGRIVSTTSEEYWLQAVQITATSGSIEAECWVIIEHGSQNPNQCPSPDNLADWVIDLGEETNGYYFTGSVTGLKVTEEN